MRSCFRKRATRTIWPFLVGYRDAVRVVFAWCELRQDFRMFRIDRVVAADFCELRYPERPAALRGRWHRQMEERERSYRARSERVDR